MRERHVTPLGGSRADRDTPGTHPVRAQWRRSVTVLALAMALVLWVGACGDSSDRSSADTPLNRDGEEMLMMAKGSDAHLTQGNRACFVNETASTVTVTFTGASPDLTIGRGNGSCRQSEMGNGNNGTMTAFIRSSVDPGYVIDLWLWNSWKPMAILTGSKATSYCPVGETAMPPAINERIEIACGPLQVVVTYVGVSDDRQQWTIVLN